jgi:LPS export ABC transporter protein LptC
MIKPLLCGAQKNIAVLLAACFFMCSCENDMKQVQALRDKVTGVEEATQIESLLSNNAQLKAKLTAPYMLRYQTDTPRVEFTRGLHVDFFNDSTQIESVLNAQYGKYTEGQNKIFLKNNVVVYNVKGDTLKTDELYWDQNLQLFFTDKPVTIIQLSPIRQTLQSNKGMTSDQNFRKFTLYSFDTNRPSFVVLPDSTTSK